MENTKTNNNTENALVLLTSNKYEIKNKDLNKNLDKMVKALQSVKKGQWSYAIALFNIKENRLYEDDFGTMENFYKAMDGIEKSYGSKCIGAVSCLVNVLTAYGYTTDNISISNAYLLACLKDDLKPFIEKHKDTNFGTMTQRKLEEMIKEWKIVKNGAIIVSDEKEETEESEDKESEGKEIQAFLTDDLLTIKIGKKLYGITLEELKEYEVKESE